jgi:hypothetical protein
VHYHLATRPAAQRDLVVVPHSEAGVTSCQSWRSTLGLAGNIAETAAHGQKPHVAKLCMLLLLSASGA